MQDVHIVREKLLLRLTLLLDLVESDSNEKNVFVFSFYGILL